MASELPKPTFLIHCDWGTNPNKRWQATACYEKSHYTAQSPELAGDLHTFLDRIQNPGQGPTLLGFDFPIGLPQTYARKAKIEAFLPFLQNLDRPEWRDFYSVCHTLDEVSLNRPFYPLKSAPKGAITQQPFLRALGLNNLDELRRTCEQAQPDRRAASPLFWTIGGNQVGKAAILGWRDILAPALLKNQIKIWPFHGPLISLLNPNSITAAEAYPAQYYESICGKLPGSKCNRDVRASRATNLFAWAKRRNVALNPDLTRAIQQGFPDGQDDAFDAFLGLCGMIELTHTYNPKVHEPQNPTLQHLEGWILGQPAQWQSDPAQPAGAMTSSPAIPSA